MFETDGGCQGWVILDAKYRSSRAAVHDALRSLHVYRDALRHHNGKALAAFIIVPALDQDAAAPAKRPMRRSPAARTPPGGGRPGFGK